MRLDFLRWTFAHGKTITSMPQILGTKMPFCAYRFLAPREMLYTNLALSDFANNSCEKEDYFWGPGWGHPGQVGAHGPDDPLPEHDEPQGDPEAPVQRDQHRRLHFVLLHYPVLTITAQRITKKCWYFLFSEFGFRKAPPPPKGTVSQDFRLPWFFFLQQTAPL